MRASIDPDEQASRYLLGLLPAAERERWEESVLADRDAYEATVAAEDDLVDAYARGELGHRERAAFERNLLAREGGAERVAFARALAAASDRAVEGGRTAGAPPGGARRRRTARGQTRSWMRWAAAAGLAALLAGGVFLGLRNVELANRVAELESALGGVEGERARLAEERDRLAARLDEERRERARAGAEAADHRGGSADRAAEVERPSRAAAPPRPTAVSYLLTVATRSGAGIPELVLAPETGRVQLQLDTGTADSFAAYRATLLAPPDGRVAWSRTGIAPTNPGGQPAVELELPAEIFVSGRHELLLEGLAAAPAEPELAAAYELDVVRRSPG